jgi:hypothetical protein
VQQLKCFFHLILLCCTKEWDHNFHCGQLWVRHRIHQAKKSCKGECVFCDKHDLLMFSRLGKVVFPPPRGLCDQNPMYPEERSVGRLKSAVCGRAIEKGMCLCCGWDIHLGRGAG